MSCSKKHIPEMGRGFRICDCGPELKVEQVEGCFKLHETPWLEPYPDNIPTDIYEVRFKNTRRSYYQNVNNLNLKRGDIVAVEASPGHDIGIISLTGDMVAKQIRRTGFTPFNGEYKKIYRKAKPYDIERWQEAIALEHDTMIQARQIAAEMGLDMKIGDVEYQGDKIKAIFYYIAEGRVDFRELIKVFAERFHIRIEMKQIGARQEAGRIGGIGACGRELCCASWVSNFSSVTTNAARVQDISLNPQKLAGQCSKLKCCLMYEYDTYADARQTIPRVKEPLQAMDGEYYLVKTDILAHTMTFSSSKDAMVNVVTIPTSRVREIIAANRAGKKVDSIVDKDDSPQVEEPTFCTGEDSITRFDNPGKRRKNRGRKEQRRQEKTAPESSDNAPATAEQQPAAKTGANANANANGGRSRRGEGRNRPNRAEKQPSGDAAATEAKRQGQRDSRPAEGEAPRRRDDRRQGRGRNQQNQGQAQGQGQPQGQEQGANRRQEGGERTERNDRQRDNGAPRRRERRERHDNAQQPRAEQATQPQRSKEE